MPKNKEVAGISYYPGMRTFEPTTLSWNKDGSKLAITGWPDQIQSIALTGSEQNSAGKVEVVNLLGHDAGTYKAVWHPEDPNLLYSSGCDWTVKKWGVQQTLTSDLRAELPNVPQGTSFMGFRGNGNLVAQFGDGTLIQMSPDHLTPISWEKKYIGTAVALDPQTDNLYTQDGLDIYAYSLADPNSELRIFASLHENLNIQSVIVHPGIKRLFATCYNRFELANGFIASFSTAEDSFGELIEISADWGLGKQADLSISGDGTLLATADRFQPIRLWQAQNLQYGFIDEFHLRRYDLVTQLSFSPSGEFLASAITDIDGHAYTLVWWIKPKDLPTARTKAWREIAKHPSAVVEYCPERNAYIPKNHRRYPEAAQAIDFSRILPREYAFYLKKSLNQ